MAVVHLKYFFTRKCPQCKQPLKYAFHDYDQDVRVLKCEKCKKLYT